MLISVNWLKDFVEIELPEEELAHILTMSGLEVEVINQVGSSLEGIIASRILSVRAHPEADRLSVCEVDAGDRILPVVCGAPNLEEGAVVPLALPKTKLPGGMEIRESAGGERR